MDIARVSPDGTLSPVVEQMPEYAIVDYAWSRAVMLMTSRHGKDCIYRYIVQYRNGSTSGVPRIADIFNSELRAHRPRMRLRDIETPITIEQSTAARIVGYHYPTEWQGGEAAFDLRAQTIVILARFISGCIESGTLHGTDSWQHSSNMFRIVNMFVHEIFHLVITHLGHGRALHAPGTTQQGGEYGETLLYGGIVDYYSTLDVYGIPQLPYGKPWFITRDSHGCTAETPVQEFIVRLLTARRLSHYHFALDTYEGPQRVAVVVPDNRPIIQDHDMCRMSTHLDYSLWSARRWPY